MQNSLSSVNPSDLKNFLKKLCIVSKRYGKEIDAARKLQIKTSGSSEIEIEKSLLDKVNRIEQDLLRINENRDKMLKEDEDKIDKLNATLMSVQAEISRLVQAKKEKEYTPEEQ